MSTTQNERRSIGDTIGALGQDLPRLLRVEGKLLKAELAEGASRLAEATMGVVAGLVIVGVALLVVVQAVILALALYMPGWLASAVVGVLLAVVGWVLIQRGRRDMKPEVLMPARTLHEIGEDKAMVEEKMR